MKWIKTLVPLSCLLLFTGCLYKPEISSTFIIDVIGIDFSQDNYTIYLVPYHQETAEESTLLKGSGSTISSALQSIEANQNKRLFLLQSNTLILGEGIYNNRMDSLLSYLNYPQKFNINMSVYTSNHLESVFTRDEVRDINFNEFNKIISHLSPNQTGDKRLFDYLKEMANEDNLYTIPFVSQNPEGELILDGGLILSNGLLFKQVSSEEYLHLQLLSSAVENQVITVSRDNQPISLTISSSSLSYSSHSNQYHLTLHGKLPHHEVEETPDLISSINQYLSTQLSSTLSSLMPDNPSSVLVSFHSLKK